MPVPRRTSRPSRARSRASARHPPTAARRRPPGPGPGTAGRGHLQGPPADNANPAAWYRDGAAPGETGPAVLYGHVDTRKGRAVFWNLGTLRKGGEVRVERADGKVAVFTIDA